MLTLSPIGVEALDDPGTDPVLVTRMLRDIARSNRWLGGVGAIEFGLRQLITAGDRGRELSLLDIGTGAADLPIAARRWARQRGVSLQVLGLERIAAAARLARSAGVPMVIGCAGAPPIGERCVDIVLLSQLVHHLERGSARRLLAQADRIARRGVIVADLRPAWFAKPGFRLAGWAMRFHPATIDDGVTSLRRGFALDDMRSLCREAGIDAQVTARPMARVVAWWRTTNEP